MLPLRRRLRLVFTAVFVLIGIGLLLLSYALIGRFPSSTVGVLAMIAVILPVAMYGLLTVTGWQRSMASGATPPRVSGWIIRHSLAPVLPIMFMFFLLGLGREMDLTPLDGQSSATTIARSMYEACVGGARKEIAQNGGSPDSPATQSRANAYCNCVTSALQREYTADEFVRLASAPGRLDKDERISRIINSCAKASSD
jgi:hypothetical protein